MTITSLSSTFLNSVFVLSILLLHFYHPILSEEIMSEKTKERLAHCPPIPHCKRGDILGFPPHAFAYVDRKRKILMEYTPKADCSSAVAGFLRTLGFEYQVDYFGWVHHFGGIYRRQCDHITPCDYFDDTWFRFKVVRNPFERAVSSFLFICRKDIFPFTHTLPALLRSGNATFEDFVNILDGLSMDEFQSYAAYHAGLQSRPYERFAYKNKQKSFFHEIVQAEDSKPALDRILAKTNVSYVLKYGGATHYQLRNNITHYVGNLSWNELDGNVPSNYGWFYNQKTKDKIEKLFLWDILLYNYSFPFPTPMF